MGLWVAPSEGGSAGGRRGGRKTAALLTNASCCQMLPNIQRTRRDKELLSPQTLSSSPLPLLLPLPAPHHNQDPLVTVPDALLGPPSDPAPCPHQSKGQQEHSGFFSQLQEFSSPGQGGAHIPGRNLTSMGT